MAGNDVIEGVAWEDLSVVLAALSHRSLNQAAQQLGIGQSTASRRLTRLEERLGGRLFDRTPDGLLPTQFALDLAPLAREIEIRMADIERLALQQEVSPEGRLRVAIPDGLASEWLLGRLDGFFNAYPKVQLDFVIGHEITDLVRRQADIAVRFIRPSAPELVFRKVGAIPIAAYAHPKHAQTPLKDLRWMMLADPENIFSETHWVKAQVDPIQTMAFSLWNALFAAIKHGLGPGLISPLIAEPAGLAQVAPNLPAPPPRDVYLVCHEALRTVPKVDAFWRWAIEEAALFLKT